MLKALVFSIEEFSTYDGPGIRTTVFLKGCPLKCSWCHNPEGQSFANQIIKAQNGCVGCGICMQAAVNGKLAQNSIALCPNRLLRISGTAYTPKGLIEKLQGNFSILAMSGGGITFSGGEPLAQPDFLTECLQLLQGRVHTALQTCGYATPCVFAQVLSLVDYVLYDIKLVDLAAHLRYTGVENDLILQNFATLCQSGKPFTVRTPLIPGVTDTEENLTAIARLLQKNGVQKIELLPYNVAAGAKYAAVGRVFTPAYNPEAPCNPHLEIFSAHAIAAEVV